MKSSQRHLYGLIASLFLIGLGLFFYRHLILDVPLTDTEKVNSWMIEANLRFIAEKNVPVKASFTIPYIPPYVAILDEYFVAQNYGVTTNLVGYNRRVTWTLRRGSGHQSMYYRAVLRETDNHNASLSRPVKMKVALIPDNQKTAMDTIIGQARQSSADIQTFAQSAVKELNKGDGNAKLLVGSEQDDSRMVWAMIAILNRAKIEAMPVQGFYLTQQSRANFKLFLAVYNDKEWVYINPRTGSAGLPKDFLIWQYV